MADKTSDDIWPAPMTAPANDESKWRLLLGALPMVQAYVRRLTGDRERADEIVQEVSVRMLTTEGPDEAERYAAWARGVVRHVIAHEWRMRRRERAEQPFEEQIIEELAVASADPEGHLDARAWVERVAGDLDSEGLQLLYRRYVLQESGKELADELESTPAAMRMRLMRLRTSVSALVRENPEALAFAFATLASAASELSMLGF
jgi:RNA polymerase sigma factor (sigma-70 family)